MKINKRKERGATLITWLIVAGFGILTASAVIKVAPYYVEFHGVKNLMKGIASESGIKTANMRQVNARIERYLNVNSLYALEHAYYNSRPGTPAKSKTKNPFKLKLLKKGKNRRALTVRYSVPQPWIGNLSFLVKFQHSVILGEPDEVIEMPPEEEGYNARKPKLNLR
jgi:hypothetical protein